MPAPATTYFGPEATALFESIDGHLRRIAEALEQAVRSPRRLELESDETVKWHFDRAAHTHPADTKGVHGLVPGWVISPHQMHLIPEIIEYAELRGVDLMRIDWVNGFGEPSVALLNSDYLDDYYQLGGDLPDPRISY